MRAVVLISLFLHFFLVACSDDFCDIRQKIAHKMDRYNAIKTLHGTEIINGTTMFVFSYFSQWYGDRCMKMKKLFRVLPTHRNVVKLYGFCECTFFAEYLQNGTLNQFWRKKNLPSWLRWNILLDITLGVVTYSRSTS